MLYADVKGTIFPMKLKLEGESKHSKCFRNNEVLVRSTMLLLQCRVQGGT